MPNSLRAAMDVREGIRWKSLRLITTAVLLCACLLNAYPLAVVAQDVKLIGVANFRDIGGYAADGGHKIKSGVIFRSGELSGLTATDQQALAVLNIRYEIDLCKEAERPAAPSHWGKDAPQVIWISVDPARDAKGLDARKQQLSLVRDSAQAKTLMQQATGNIAINGAAEIGKVLGELAKGNAPALIHCSAGKDRTGVTVAVLMTLLGASREDVYHEYALSNEAADAQLQRQKAREQSGKDVYGLSSLSPVVLKTLMGTDPSYFPAQTPCSTKSTRSTALLRRTGGTVSELAPRRSPSSARTSSSNKPAGISWSKNKKAPDESGTFA
jgi:protein-tyrosine phosphatase